jgi:hypothetical protein
VRVLSVEATSDWGREGEIPAEHSAGFRRFVSLGILVAVLALLAGAFQLMKSKFNPPVSAPVVTIDESDDTLKESVVREAGETVRRFYRAESIDAMLKEVRHPEITRPRLEAFYASQAIIPQEIKVSNEWLSINDPPSKLRYISTNVEADYKPIRIVVHLDKDDVPKLDWEHLVSWSEIPWVDFLSRAVSQQHTFRVRVKPGDYYPDGFGNQLKYLCFSVKGARRSESCFGYCEISSPVADALLRTLRAARHSQQVDPADNLPFVDCILKLRFPENGKSNNQVFIEGFEREGWIIPSP